MASLCAIVAAACAALFTTLTGRSRIQLIGQDALDQAAIDAQLIALDGTRR